MTTERRAFSSRSSNPSPLAAVLRWPDQRQQKPCWERSRNALCDHLSSYPGRRRSISIQRRSIRGAGKRSWTMLQLLLFTTVALLCCSRRAGASSFHAASHVEEISGLVYDRSEPPALPMHLHRRQETTTSLAASITSQTSSGQASAASSGSGSLNTATPTSQSVLPSPFDSTLGNNFTAPSCPPFFQGFLSNETFKQCLPLSLLLQTSNGFFAAERNSFRLTETLEATCDVDFPTCSALMASLAQDIQQQSNCGQDLEMQNPIVVQAYKGFVGYQPLYHAGCLQDTSGSYCFADAVTNKSAPTSSYIYYLPLGVQLPADSMPACNKCLQNTMAIFAAAASNSSVPLNDDYTNAAQQVDTSCGSKFVEASIDTTSAGISLHPRSAGLGLLSLLVVLLGFFR